MSKVIGLIPAAGKATRLQLPIPKELLPVPAAIGAEEEVVPVIERTIDNMGYVNVDEYVIVVRPEKAASIMQCIAQMDLTVPVSYVVQNDFNGPASSPGLLQAIDSAYMSIKDSNVLFGMPDTIVEPTHCYQDVRSPVLNGEIDLSFGLFETNTPQKYGMVDTDILTVYDKPDVSTLKYMWGILAWSYQFTELLHYMYAYKKCTDFAHVLNEAIVSLRTEARLIENGSYYDIATKVDYRNLWLR